MSDVQTQYLLVSSGDGPQECRRAVALVIAQIRKEAASNGLKADAELSGDNGSEHCPPSALITLTGNGAEALAGRWTGTVQWTCQSPFRPHHKRRNWFVGVFKVSISENAPINLAEQNLKIETFRSGGPGGQHQNTTDSGVRITHLPSRISAVSTDERSQHRNKQVALERLLAKSILKQQETKMREQSSQNLLHKQLERGNPVRTFKGERFQEAK
ncbi:peptide chain release factor H [Roseibium suaedae]|uniref:Peptide chain release factor n=1 Tax=Roseibium suaedae TaxID=735517 RepID=A0A1M7GCM3_9HYPH|nr:peptide chain release factor H [Roseibium suaedae]SHM14040.1 peptide chain release factor [Roseibium suaedae]